MNTFTKLRYPEIDFMKGIFIILMILFHLTYFSIYYPCLLSWVYSYHMPGFLIISGFLFKVGKNWEELLKSLKSLFIPYIIFLCIYCIGIHLLGSVLGANNAVGGYQSFL